MGKGTIEIMNTVELIKTGDRVGMSESTLLNMLGISPFNYGLVVKKVYDSGSIFDPTILDITDDDLKDSIMAAVRNVAALSLSIGYPTLASVPHSIVNGMKNLLAIADITFKEAEMMKEYLADPSKFASAVVADADAEAAAPVEEAKPEEPDEDESDDDMGFGLFD